MFIYLYDCKNARSANARRVAFTKELYGYTYSWRTKTGLKQQRKPGLIDECVGSRAVANSAILVPDQHRPLFDSLFSMYEDILTLRVFRVEETVIE